MPGRSPSFRIDHEKVQDYAQSLGMRVSWIGHGDFGEAFETSENTVIKITNDKTERDIAKELEGKTFSNVVNIYSVRDNLIHMEKLDTSDIQELYEETVKLTGSRNWPIRCFNMDLPMEQSDYPHVSANILKMLNDICVGMYELQRVGFTNSDVKWDNIGKKPNGDYAMFDISIAKMKSIEEMYIVKPQKDFFVKFKLDFGDM